MQAVSTEKWRHHTNQQWAYHFRPSPLSRPEKAPVSLKIIQNDVCRGGWRRNTGLRGDNGRRGRLCALLTLNVETGKEICRHCSRPYQWWFDVLFACGRSLNLTSRHCFEIACRPVISTLLFVRDDFSIYWPFRTAAPS